jgi:hypothetical protein
MSGGRGSYGIDPARDALVSRFGNAGRSIEVIAELRRHGLAANGRLRDRYGKANQTRAIRSFSVEDVSH